MQGPPDFFFHLLSLADAKTPLHKYLRDFISRSSKISPKEGRQLKCFKSSKIRRAEDLRGGAFSIHPFIYKHTSGQPPCKATPSGGSLLEIQTDRQSEREKVWVGGLADLQVLVKIVTPIFLQIYLYNYEDGRIIERTGGQIAKLCTFWYQLFFKV